MSERLPSLLLHVITQPTEAFRRILVRRPLGLAALLVILPSVLSTAVQATAICLRGGDDLDVVMRLGVMSFVQSVIVFCALVLLCHVGATQIAKGTGKLSDMFLVAGFACLIQTIEVAVPMKNALMSLVWFAWQVLLVVLGIKEAYKLESMPGGLTGGVAKVLVSLLGQCVTLYALPYAIDAPFPPPGDTPAVTITTPQELLRNTGFEQHSEDPKGKIDIEHWQRMGAIPLGVWGVHWGKDHAMVHAGKTSAVVSNRWLPVGVYVGWMQSSSALLREGESVRLSARIRTKGTNAAAMTLSFTEARRREHKPTRGAKAGSTVHAYSPVRGISSHNTALIRGDTQWREYTLTAVVPKPSSPEAGDAKGSPTPPTGPVPIMAHVGIGFWGGGTVWIDDVSLVVEQREREPTRLEIPPPDAPPQTQPAGADDKTPAAPKSSPQS